MLTFVWWESLPYCYLCKKSGGVQHCSQDVGQANFIDIAVLGYINDQQNSTRTRHVRTTLSLSNSFSKLTVVFAPFYYRLYVSEDLIGLSLHQNIGYGFQRFCSPTKTKSTIMYKSQNYIYSYPDAQRLSAFRDTIVMNVYGMIVL